MQKIRVYPLHCPMSQRKGPLAVFTGLNAERNMRAAGYSDEDYIIMR